MPRPMTLEESRALLARAPQMTIAGAAVDGRPVLRTMHGVLLDDRIAFHGGPKGEKHVLRDRPVVVAAEEVVVRIPSHWIDPRRACPATTWYRSVHVHGVLRAIEDVPTRTAALAALMDQFQPEGGFVPITVDEPLYARTIAGLLVMGVAVDEVIGRSKVGEERGPKYLSGVVAGLWGRGGPGDLGVIELIRRHTPETPLPACFAGPPDVSLHAEGDAGELSDAIALLTGQYWNTETAPEKLAAAHRASDAWVTARDPDGALIGTARAVGDQNKRQWIYDVAVAPAWQGRGVGRALMRLALDHPAVRTADTVLLGTRDAQGLYAKFGFVPAPPRFTVMARRAG